eukprot:g30076.t1
MREDKYSWSSWRENGSQAEEAEPAPTIFFAEGCELLAFSPQRAVNGICSDVCSDEGEHDGHLKVLNDVLIRTGYDAQLIDHQFRHTIAKNHNDLLRKQTRDKSNWVPFVTQYFPGAKKLRHVLRSLQHVIDDIEHLAKIFATPPLLAFKQTPNLKQNIVCNKLPSLQDNINHNTIQPCHSNLCKACQIIHIDITITHGTTTQHKRGRYS